MANKIKYIKQYQFEHANKIGKWLAYKTKKQRERNIITKLKYKGIEYNQQEKIKQIATEYYGRLYTADKVTESKKIEIQEFIKKEQIPKF